MFYIQYVYIYNIFNIYTEERWFEHPGEKHNI